MYFVILNTLGKPKFDKHLDGALTNAVGMVQPNIFGLGDSLKQKTNQSYSININEKLSKIGKLRDKLSVYIHSSIYLFVVSQSAKKLLVENASDEVEFYSFKFRDGEVDNKDYSIVNVINKIDCVDVEKSDVQFEEYNDDPKQNDIYTIDSLVLNTSLIPPQQNIFLLGRSVDPVIIVHERLKKKMEEAGLSGFVFCAPEDFQL